MAQRFTGPLALLLAACLGVLPMGGCGGGDGPKLVSVWVQNSDHLDAGGGPDGDAWGGILGAYNIIALDYQRVDISGPVVSVTIVPGGLDENEFVFVGDLVPGVYEFTATYSANSATDQALYLGAPPRLSSDTPLASFASVADSVDLSALGGKQVTLVIQGAI